MLRKDGKSDDVPREVIDHNSDPPAERPDLKAREWKPGDPETGPGGDNGQINMIDVVGGIWL